MCGLLFCGLGLGVFHSRIVIGGGVVVLGGVLCVLYSGIVDGVVVWVGVGWL